MSEDEVYATVAPLLKEALGDDVMVVVRHFDHDDRFGVAVEFPNGYRNAFRVPADDLAAQEKAASEFIAQHRPEKPKHYRLIAEGGIFS